MRPWFLSGSVRTGRILRWFGLLRTPEEKHLPPIMLRRDELLARATAVPGDGLRFIARNRQARFAHITGNLVSTRIGGIAMNSQRKVCPMLIGPALG